MNWITSAGNGASRVRRGPILICLGLIVVFPLFSVPMQASIHSLAPRIGEIAARVVAEGAIWLYGAIVLVIALRGEGRTLASIGLRKPTFGSLGFAIVGVVAMMGAGGVAAYVVYGLLHQARHMDAQAGALVNGSVFYALCLAVRAGVIEEIFFRGLAIEQLTVLTGSRWLSALLPTAYFVVIHALRFDWVQLVPIAAVSIVLAGLYLWRHDLWANILAHIAVDAVGLVAVAVQAHKLTH
ncbi:MAG TPA: CPBP family intramembrane glutamic endopeptidase [Pyrinomonadaceae bacterium]